MKLILGTASFGPKAYGEGVTEPPTADEIKRILDIAFKGGIRILEGSEAYHCDWVFEDPRFQVIYKVTHPYSIIDVYQKIDPSRLLGLLYHHGHTTAAKSTKKGKGEYYVGSSIYDFEQIVGDEEMIEVPFNIEDVTFKDCLWDVPCKLVRSVFGRGKLLKTHSVKECLDFVKSDPSVHGVIVGVNSVAEIQEIIKAWNS
jgi:hypothetical protein